MKQKIALNALSIDGLLARYVELCIKREQAEHLRRIAELNRQIEAIWAVEAELAARPGDARTALVSLFGHANRQVQVAAACTVSRFAPELARPLLEVIVRVNFAPYSYQARERLMHLDDPFL